MLWFFGFVWFIFFNFPPKQPLIQANAAQQESSRSAGGGAALTGSRAQPGAPCSQTSPRRASGALLSAEGKARSARALPPHHCAPGLQPKIAPAPRSAPHPAGRRRTRPVPRADPPRVGAGAARPRSEGTDTRGERTASRDARAQPAARPAPLPASPHAGRGAAGKEPTPRTFPSSRRQPRFTSTA